MNMLRTSKITATAMWEAAPRHQSARCQTFQISQVPNQNAELPLLLSKKTKADGVTLPIFWTDTVLL